MGDLNSEVEERLRAYLDEVLRANRQFNLTAVRDENTAWTKHILDSLEGLSTPLFDGTRKVIDVGTGAGFPGAVLAIARPQLEVTLLEATRKKCHFLESAAARLAPNARVLCGRAEEFGHDAKYRESFDIAVARAVGSLTEVLELCLPFVVPGGRVLLWRGQNAGEEIASSQRAFAKLKCRAQVVRAYRLPEHEISYHLVCAEKMGSTPSAYPRRVGLPKQKPL